MKKDNGLIIINFCYRHAIFFGSAYFNVSESEFMNCIKTIKPNELIEISKKIKRITTKDFFEIVLIHLPNETVNKIDEILLFNSLSFTKKIIYKLKKIFTNGI